jgi:hypothetical protein
MSSLYDFNTSLISDECWKNAKEYNNERINNYTTYYNDTAEVKKSTGTFPDLALDHINLRGRPGYGVTDGYLVDNYSQLITPESTVDRCSIQLLERTFTGGPKLKRAKGDIDNELDLLSGSEGRSPGINCYKGQLMETNINNFMPMLENIREVQNPENIIPIWVNGGEDTRSYINKLKFSKCNSR